MKSEQNFHLAINFIPHIGSVSAKTMIGYCGGIENLFKSKRSELINIPGIGEIKSGMFINSKNEALRKAEKEMAQLEKTDIETVFYLESDYPQRLKQYSDCPLVLYKKGKIDPNPNRSVAIVGTRQPSAYGVHQCERIVEELKNYNCTIISGLAYGIDTVAHRKSVELKIPTVGILGNGINKIYPSTNRELAQKMKSLGGLYSEFPLDTKPDRENFPRRNRIIAAFSDVVLVVESAIKGGSIITAEYANNYYKDVFAIPGHLDYKMSEGCNQLIKTHKAHLCMSAKDIAYIMRWDQKQKTQQMELNLVLCDKESKIYELLKSEKEFDFDKLIYETNFSLPELNAMLLNLEFKGLVKSLPGKKYILS